MNFIIYNIDANQEITQVGYQQNSSRISHTAPIQR